MSRPQTAAYCIDHPTTWCPERPDQEIVGWIYAGPGHECRDLRVLVDGVVFHGIYGLERLDVQQAFPDDPTARCTGFLVRTRLWHGARTLAFEFLDEHNTWQPLATRDLDTSRLPGVARPRPMLRAALVSDSLRHLYRHHHRESWAQIRRAADAIVAEITSFNTNITAEGPFRGYLENPSYWINARYDKFRVTGWTFATGHTIAKLSAITGGISENRLVFGKERPDVAAHFPAEPQSGTSAFYGLVDLKTDIPSPACLRIFATMADGTKKLAFARRLHLDKHDEHSGPVPVFNRTAFALCALAFFRSALLRRIDVDSWADCWRDTRLLQRQLGDTLGRATPAALPAAVVRRSQQDPYSRWAWHNRPTPRLLAALALDANTAVAAGGPLISVVVPAYNTPERYLRELLDCLRAQLYPRWELCIADDASPQPHVRRLLEAAAQADPRIRPVFRAENGHISRATNSALEIATGEFVALLDHDDLLPPDALLHIAEAVLAHPTAGYLYTDEDKIDDSGRRYDPQFKGDWSPEMAITHNYTHHLSIIRRSVVAAVGGLRPEFNGAQDIDLFLRCFEHIPDADIVHVPFVCYHWRAHAESTATRGDQKGYLFDAARRAIAEACQRRGLRAEPFLPEWATRYACCLHQLRWDPALLRENPVTIVIPTKNRGDLLARCLDSLARTTPRESVKIVVVNDGSDDPATLDLLRALPARADLRCTVLDLPADPAGFNYSRLVNLGSAQADTPLLLHLNNDVEALAPGWLEELAGWLSIAGVGVVGAQLLYPDETINHAGISFSRTDGLPHVLFERTQPEELGYLFLPHAARNVAAVTGACLLTRTADYRALAGFDEQSFRVAYNDIDYCLRAAARGLRTVYTPQAVLRHVGSASRGNSYTEREHVAFVAAHGRRRDPYLADALDFPPAALALNPYHHRPSARPRPFRAIVVTHNLKFEGAPIFIFELARYLAAQPGVSLRVVSPEDGPLRARFEQAGLPVQLVDAAPIFAAATPAAQSAALATLAQDPAWADTDLFICNTMVTFWAVQVARRLDRPSVLYIHESMAVRKFFSVLLPAATLDAPAAAIREATRVVFTAEATRKVFEDLDADDNFRSLKSWVDIDRIESFCAASDKRALRRKHGLPEDAVLLVNIGSVCERKGQHVFVRAIDLLNKTLATRFPGRPPIEFVIVGGRPGLYMESLLQDIELLGLTNLHVVSETPDIYDFYRLADVLVCTSFEESFPRVLLEAMVFRLPIVSTNVNGIPEMLVDNDEALLVPAGDTFKLVAALERTLDDLFAGRTNRTALAYAHAARHFHHARALPRHLELCREALLS